MREIIVELGPRSYPILIGPGLLSSAEVMGNLLTATQVMVVTNSVVERLYLERLLASLRGFDARHLIIPDGEQYKTLEVFDEIKKWFFSFIVD